MWEVIKVKNKDQISAKTAKQIVKSWEKAKSCGKQSKKSSNAAY